MKLVEITYEDITMVEDKNSEVLLATNPKILKVYGALLDSGKRYRVVWNWDEEGTSHDALIIPKENVIKVTELKVMKK